jgi:hypothetical protein
MTEHKMTLEEAVKFLEDLQTFARPEWSLYDNSDIGDLASAAAVVFKSEIANAKDEVELWKKNRNIYVEKKNKLWKQIEEVKKLLGKFPECAQMTDEPEGVCSQYEEHGFAACTCDGESCPIVEWINKLSAILDNKEITEGKQ